MASKYQSMLHGLDAMKADMDTLLRHIRIGAADVLGNARKLEKQIKALPKLAQMRLGGPAAPLMAWQYCNNLQTAGDTLEHIKGRLELLEERITEELKKEEVKGT